MAIDADAKALDSEEEQELQEAGAFRFCSGRVLFEVLKVWG